ncbi:Hok/Gef family protein [Capnocytophaga genosp. AHN8471]
MRDICLTFIVFTQLIRNGICSVKF